MVLQNDVGNYYGQKSLPFLHTFDILEGSVVRHDNKSDNTQCMKRNRRRTHAKKARKMAYFRAFSMVRLATHVSNEMCIRDSHYSVQYTVCQYINFGNL